MSQLLQMYTKSMLHMAKVPTSVGERMVCAYSEANDITTGKL